MALTWNKMDLLICPIITWLIDCQSHDDPGVLAGGIGEGKQCRSRGPGGGAGKNKR